MARSERPAEYAVLGLLSLEEGGSHGYDLARHLAPGQPLGAVLRLEPGMLYHHLKRLEQAGMAAPAPDREGNRPPRQVYRITEAGREALRRWLQSPVRHTREIRLEFLVKLYFAMQLDPRLAVLLARSQRETLQDVYASLQEDRRTSDDRDAAGEFLQSVVDLRLAQTSTAIAWLDALLVRLELAGSAGRAAMGMP
jgi:DNA-binding PadR family transcriptional regulator